MALTYSVYRSKTFPRFPNVISGVTRADAVECAVRTSASDTDGRASVITRDDNDRWIAEYRRGELTRSRH
jgi:hypothetical protein